MLPSDIVDERIRRYADFQLNWQAILPRLQKDRFTIAPADTLSIPGDAPKSFLRIREHADGTDSGKKSRRRRITRLSSHWPGYIAKVGSKWYPVESVTEQLLTRVGQLYGVRIADSQLRIVGNQVRFLSRYFLKKGESLFHGIDLFKHYLRDEQLVEEIARARQEQDFYTFQTVREAIQDRFPEHVDDIMEGMVEMLTFDAIVGNNDRHPANWGVVVAATGSSPPRFSPVFDTARGLFWNIDESLVRATLSSDERLSRYVSKSRPQIGWEGCTDIGHFDLIEKIYQRHPDLRPQIEKFVGVDKNQALSNMVEREFSSLMSSARRELILRCLERRGRLLRESVESHQPSSR